MTGGKRITNDRTRCYVASGWVRPHRFIDAETETGPSTIFLSATRPNSFSRHSLRLEFGLTTETGGMIDLGPSEEVALEKTLQRQQARAHSGTLVLSDSVELPTDESDLHSPLNLSFYEVDDHVGVTFELLPSHDIAGGVFELTHAQRRDFRTFLSTDTPDATPNPRRTELVYPNGETETVETEPFLDAPFDFLADSLRP